MKKQEEHKVPAGGQVEAREITEELKESYLDYAMSVIVSRALPDVRDGLKPVHRRILWTMWEDGLTASAKFRKSANVVGSALGRYHPHGDTALYDAMARMAQDFSLRYPLINGQGNWGSIDGDSPAAMRYCVTEDSLVVTGKGLVNIGTLADKEEIDVKVLSKDRKVHKASKWFDSGEHPTIQITTDQGFSVRGSCNHPILTWIKNPENNEPSFKWKMLSEIQEGDVAVMERTADLLWPEHELGLMEFVPERKNKRTKEKILPKFLNKDLAHILGAITSEGTIKEHKIEFCNSDAQWIKEFKRRWKNVFPDCRLHAFKRKQSSFGKKEYYRIEIHSRYVIEFLKNLGLKPAKSEHRRMPKAILYSPKHVVREFLCALFEGDGSISYSSKMTELSHISKSEKLVQELQILLLRFGIVGTKRFDKWRGTHKLYLRGLRNCSIFRESIDFVSKRKRDKLRKAIERLNKDYSQKDYIPFLKDFVSGPLTGTYYERNFTEKHNIDGYPNLEKHRGQLLTLVQEEAHEKMDTFFETLLSWNYLFDPIVEVKKKASAKVYSIKVESDCHSFVANGFVNHNTEAKLAKIASETLLDIEKETVDWNPNYDASRQEPTYLPAKLPNLLLNGTMGIAVGMATSIPPHGLNELCDAIAHLIEHPDATIKDLMKHIPGPDFPTGGIIYDKKGIEEAYATGKGSVPIRAVAEVEETDKGQGRIVITEIPYQVQKADLITKMAMLVQDKKIEGIKDIRDESDREGLRIVIDAKTDAIPQKILNKLYKTTDLQKNFYLNMIALVDGIQPRLLSLKEILEEYVKHRKEVVRRRIEFDLKKAKERAHILEGLVKALGSIDKIIAAIKKSKDRPAAEANLIKNFTFTPIQAGAILDMRLATLAALERQKLEDELKEKRQLIKELEVILKSPKRMEGIIKDELEGLKKAYGDERKTKIVASGLKEFSDEDLVPNEETIITLSRTGYIKRMPPSTFRSQKRGGKGLMGSEVKEEDQIEHFTSAETHDNILFFTTSGKVFQTKVYEVPAGSRIAKGKLIYNFLEVPQSDKVRAIVTYETPKKDSESQFLTLVTERGLIKKTPLEDYANVRRTGIIAINLKKEDALQWAMLAEKDDQFIVVTKRGQSIRFKESDARPMGRAASGVTAIKLKKDDEVIGLDIIRGKGAEELLIIMANGYAKRTPLKEYKVQNRGGSGIKTARVTAKTGEVIASQVVGPGFEELIAFSSRGQALRTGLKDIRKASRDTQGVRVMNLKAGDKLIGIVCL